MTKEEIIAYLKENLKVDVNVNDERDFCGKRLEVKVSISLGSEEIASSSDSIMVIE